MNEAAAERKQRWLKQVSENSSRLWCGWTSCPKAVLSPEHFARCEEFGEAKKRQAEQSAEDGEPMYGDSGQENPEAIGRQFATGAKGEFGVAMLVKEHGIKWGATVTAPDLRVRERGDRSFDPDLKVLAPKRTGMQIHVKSCEVDSVSLTSWTVQTGSSAGRRDTRLLQGRPSDLLAFTVVDGRAVYLCGVVPTALIKTGQLPLEEPERLHLRRFKRCIYPDKLERLTDAVRFQWDAVFKGCQEGA